MADQVIRKRMIDGEEYDVIYRHSVPLKDLNTIPGGWGYYSPMNQRTYERDGIICEQDVAIPLRDGVTVYADIYRPADMKKIPCIMAWSIYGKRPHDMRLPMWIRAAADTPKGKCRSGEIQKQKMAPT